MTSAPFFMSPNPPIAFGVGRADQIAQDVENLAGEGASILLVGDPNLPKLLDQIVSRLRKAGHSVEVFTDVRSDPLGSQVDSAAELARSKSVNVIIGLGGGSTMDVAKLTAAVASDSQAAEHYSLAKNPLPRPTIQTICLPTTSGTGSEATRVSIFTTAKGEKVWAWGDELRASLAILDPTLTVGMPPALTAATGVDALVHAIEAMTIRRANVMNNATCLQAIRLVRQHLPQAVREPNDLEARGGMQIASCLAGLAIDNSGTGIAHAIGHALGAVGHVHHGRAVGLSLRVALGWNAEAAPESHAQVAAALGVPSEKRPTKDTASDLAPAFDQFLREVGVRISLEQEGLSSSDTDRLTKTIMAPENRAMRDSNIREIAESDARHFARLILTAA